jgi:translation initiation factor IF-1
VIAVAAAAVAAAVVIADLVAISAAAVVGIVTNSYILNVRGGVPVERRPVRFLFKTKMEEHIEVEGRILTVLAGTMFRVELDNKHQVLATISGKMRKKFVRLTTGDRVKMEMSQYDLNKARIVWRIG